jgi:hypothetical protein
VQEVNTAKWEYNQSCERSPVRIRSKGQEATSSDRRAWRGESDKSRAGASSCCMVVVALVTQGGTPGGSACRGSSASWRDDEKSGKHRVREWLHGHAWWELMPKEDAETGACEHAGKQRRARKTRPDEGRTHPRVFVDAGVNRR